MIVRAQAEYQLMGDVTDYREWLGLVLSPAVERGDLVAYSFSDAQAGGRFGIVLLRFTADFEVASEGETYESITDFTTNRLNEFIGDSDIEVRWLSIVSDD